MEPLEDRLRSALADHYRLERELGRGGMATVYLATDLKHGRSVAVKVLAPELSAMLGAERFGQEIAFAASLQHPHILTVLDSGAGAGLTYYVMPFVEGESLRARLNREGQLAIGQALELGSEVARALDYAHRRGVIHRDIKPENILLADGQAMISDFGLARAIHASGGPRLTQSGMTLGTPPYMSPEQLAGEREIDGRSDIYSLGCVLYEMLAGQPPFAGPLQSLAHQHLNVEPRPVSELRPSVTPELWRVLKRALAKAPADRFGTAGEMADALRGIAPPEGAATAAMRPAVAGGPGDSRAATVAVVESTPAGGGVAPRRGLRAWVGIALALVAAVALGVWAARGLMHHGAPDGAVMTPRKWVWIAAFDGPSDDGTLAPAARDLVAATLDQSKVLAVVPEQQVAIALHNAGRPESTRIDAALARELAYRSSIPVVVEGRLARIGAGYSIVLKAGSATDGRSLVSLEGQAAEASALMPVLVRLSRQLRAALGERAADLRAAQSLGDVMTPSFEAFKLYTRARELNTAGQVFAALPIAHQAIAIDPEFASAWVLLGTLFGNIGEADSALLAYGEALRHPGRLGEVQRMDIAARVAVFQGDPRGAIAAYTSMLQLDPSPTERASALNNIGVYFSLLGDEEHALEYYRRSGVVWPVQPPGIYWQNLTDSMIGLGRTADARVPLAHIPPDAVPGLSLLGILLVERRTASADSLARALSSDPTVPAPFRAVGMEIHASLTAQRGELETAARDLDELQSAPENQGNMLFMVTNWMTRAWFAELCGRPAPAVPGPAARALAPLIASLHDAMAGDSAGARRRIQAWQPNVGMQRWVKNGAAGLIQGRADLRRRDWDRVVEELRPNAACGSRNEPPPLAALRAPSRWLIADAFEGLGKPDSARVYLERLLEPPGNHDLSLLGRGFSEPFVRQRLVRINLSLGHVSEARRQWDQLAVECVHPDPPLAASLDETRSALLAAEGMGARARK